MTDPPPPVISNQLLPEVVEKLPRSSKDEHVHSHTNLPGETSTLQKDAETTTGHTSIASEQSSRRFLPQPVEESMRSSRKHKAGQGEEPIHTQSAEKQIMTNKTQASPILQSNLPSDPTAKPTTSTNTRRFVPEPLETTSKHSRRKFAPEAVETSIRSSKDKKEEEPEDIQATKPARRKFAPEPVENSARSSKDKKTAEQDKPSNSTARRKFAPEPVETTTTRRRRKPKADEDEEEEEDNTQVEENPDSSTTTPSRTSSGGRKFSPELLETAKGSFRRDYISPSSTPRKSTHPASTTEEVDKLPDLSESRFSAAALARKHHEEFRQKSFIVPDLPMIESDSGDEGSDAPSLTSSLSSLDGGQRKASRAPNDAVSYTEYVLRLAAETATEKELQDQAMAAYINERPHEPVDHFAIDHDEEEDGQIHVGRFSGHEGADIQTFRRSSADDLDWEMENMRKHHEQLEKVKREFKADTAGHSRFSAAALATRHHLEAAKGRKTQRKASKPKTNKTKKTKVADSELSKMRAAASPPMLGDDLVFPQTVSPKMTRCDTDQVPRPRRADSDDEDVDMEGDTQLWSANVNIGNQDGVGLWMGMCQRNQQEFSHPPTPIRSGIQTPAVEIHNPFGSSTPGRGGSTTPGRKAGRIPFSALSLTRLPLTPPQSSDGDDTFTNAIDRKLQLEQQIEDEFPNRVITQIYNYLSLGYPSLAHGFDDELSKISRISIEELRRDDDAVDVKGHVGAPEGDGCDENEIMNRCKRWEALKIYVHEWARQSPNFVDPKSRGGKAGANEAWGVAVRKGSWAH